MPDSGCTRAHGNIERLLVAPGSQGNSLPGESVGDGNLLDIKGYDITSLRWPGANTLRVRLSESRHSHSIVNRHAFQEAYRVKLMKFMVCLYRLVTVISTSPRRCIIDSMRPAPAQGQMIDG